MGSSHGLTASSHSCAMLSNVKDAGSPLHHVDGSSLHTHRPRCNRSWHQGDLIKPDCTMPVRSRTHSSWKDLFAVPWMIERNRIMHHFTTSTAVLPTRSRPRCKRSWHQGDNHEPLTTHGWTGFASSRCGTHRGMRDSAATSIVRNRNANFRIRLCRTFHAGVGSFARRLRREGSTRVRNRVQHKQRDYRNDATLEKPSRAQQTPW